MKLVMLFFFGIINYYSIKDTNLCSNISVGHDIMCWEKNENIFTENKCIPWDEYDPNYKKNIIPDSINIQTILDCVSYIFGNDIPIEDFYVTVKLNLKLSENPNCIVPINSLTSKDYLLITNKKISFSDFFVDNVVDYSKYKIIKINSTFKIRDSIKEYENKNIYLNQLLITTILFDNDNNKVCSFEYTYYICAEQPKDYHE